MTSRRRYYGRPFEARNKPKGSSFNDDNKDYVRYQLGSNQFIPAFEEAIAGMHVSGRSPSSSPSKSTGAHIATQHRTAACGQAVLGLAVRLHFAGGQQ